MLHDLDGQTQRSVANPGHNVRYFLQDETARGLGPLATELDKIVAGAAANID